MKVLFLVSKLNSNLGGCSFGLTEDGRPGWKDGADTVFPFSNKKLYTISTYISANKHVTFTAEIDDITLLFGYINGGNTMAYIKEVGSISSNVDVSISGSTVSVFNRIGSGQCNFYYI